MKLRFRRRIAEPVARAVATPVRAVLAFVPEGTLPGLALMAAAAAALIVANSPLGPAYEAVRAQRIGPFPLHRWIDDALMALFFFQVGLELKREFVVGDLATPAARRMPIAAAAAGMGLPVLVYLAVTAHLPHLARGWAVPAATDIAFALGVLTLLGNRVSGSLRLFLVSIAIADDIGAVAIIALAYTATLNGTALALAGALLGALWALNRRGVRTVWPYAVLTVALWTAMARSGVHPTIAGVLAAQFLPLARDGAGGPLESAEHVLAPWVSCRVC